MTADVLIDTGAILALLDETDRWHKACSATLQKLPLPLLTSEAVLTETFHLIKRVRAEFDAVWTQLRLGTIQLATIENSELPELEKLMNRYQDRPMDFADATLVYLAERESINIVFSVDQADFATYRIGGKRKFHILPLERP
jgi:predicted nucleic acid-binding protein